MRRFLVVPLLVAAAACGSDPELERLRETSRGTYDPDTGRLTQITYDRDGNGRIDTWTKMDGARPVSSELDTNEDGLIDRWEEYDARGQLVKAAWRRAPVVLGPGGVPGPAVPDSFAFVGADGRVERIEYEDVDNAGNRVITRREFYENDAIVRVEEDKDGDGRMDQWETHRDGRVYQVEFDDGADGRPDRRFTYDESGALVLIETDPGPAGAYRTRTVPGGAPRR